MMLIRHTHSSQFVEWQNLHITTLKHHKCAPIVFKKLPENQITTNFTYLTSPKFATLSHLKRSSQFLENIMEILE